MFDNKKGQIAEFRMLPAFAIILVVTVIVFALGIVVLSNFQSSSSLSISSNVNNESFTVPFSNSTVNGTVTLANQNMTSFLSINNGTVDLGTGNYSVALSTGVVTFISPNNFSGATCRNQTTCYATYVYTSKSSTAYTSVTKGIAVLNEIPNNWLLLFVIVVASGLLVTTVVVVIWKSGVGGFGGGGSVGGNRT